MLRIDYSNHKLDWLFGRTIPPNNTHTGGTVPPNNTLAGGLVPPNNTHVGGTLKI